MICLLKLELKIDNEEELYFIYFYLHFFISFVNLILSSIGIETDRFNTFILKKINLYNNISLELNTVKFKLDIKEISLFLNTKSPILQYRRISIPARNIKVYIDFISLIKADPNIKKINIVFDNIDINQIKKYLILLNPQILQVL